MCHTAKATLDVLSSGFEDRIISLRATVVWPPLSCVLTPLDYSLWGAFKDKCYADKSETSDALKDNIREVIGLIGNIWFQQDGAMCHTAEAILDILGQATSELRF